MMLPSLLALSLCAPAVASEGPWTVGAGTASVYVGVESERITRLAGAEGSYGEGILDVDEGISKSAIKAIVSYGLAPGTEIELAVPWASNHMNRTDGPLCAALGAETCRPTQGLGVLDLRVKRMLLDELSGPPISLSVGLEARFGMLAWSTHKRLTNLGDGTFDLGGSAWVGRSGGMGAKGYWSISAGGDVRYRFPNLTAGDTDVPGWETDGLVELLFAPRSVVAFGPEFGWFARPVGTDVETANLADPDWISGLSVTRFAVGASVHLRARQGVTFSLAAFRNVWARNNPTDDFLLSAGVQVSRIGAREPRR